MKKKILLRIMVLVIVFLLGVGSVLVIQTITKQKIDINRQLGNVEPSPYFIKYNNGYDTDSKGNSYLLSAEGNKMVIPKDFSLYLTDGISMRPSIGYNSILIVEPNVNKDNLQVGDIVLVNGESHRIINITEDGFNTQGDNNAHQDIFLRRFSDIKGKVVGVLY